MGLILAKVINDFEVTDTVEPQFFGTMDSVAERFIGPDEVLEVPILRIVFALMLKKHSVQWVTTQRAWFKISRYRT